MSGFSGELFEILTYLLPGFVATVIFYSLTSHPKPSNLMLLVHALIFTTLIGAINLGIILVFAETYGSMDQAGRSTWDSFIPVCVGIGLALLIVTLVNHDVFHSVFRWANISRESSFPSEWYSSFAKHYEDCFVVLHLVDGRRFYGWSEEWPSDPKHGHFRITQGEWLVDEWSAKNKEVETTSVVYAMLVPVAHVEMVEFVKATAEASGGRK